MIRTRGLSLAVAGFLLGVSTMAQAEIIRLPPADTEGSLPLEQAIARRRSVRSFDEKGLSEQQLGQLLWAGQGITAGNEGRSFRAAPSAGALYPMELYAVTPEGVFHYLPEGHRLEVKTKEDRRQMLSRAALGQGSVGSAPVSIVVCAVYERVMRKYGQRGRRYTDIEAGHVAQNIHLQAVALGLGSVPVGAFDDAAVQRVIGVSSDEQPLYVIPVGRRLID
ncbi:MAG: SagB/ThcOx family dehydrogenase [Candidatus Omnitrophica bacterium]|nr:SagB/ThcOx family dehydrogenase [Candidatus Omnitrophota bacterium]